MAGRRARKFQRFEMSDYSKSQQMLRSLVESKEMLKESEERYQAVVETATDAILLCRNDKIIYWNKSAERIFGYTKEEVIGKPVLMLMPDQELANKHQKSVDRYVKTGQSKIMGKQVYETFAKKKDGTVVPVELSLADNKPITGHSFTGVLRDITERRRAEEEIKSIANRLFLVLESTDEGVFAVDENVKCTLFNRAAYHLTGFKPDEVIGRDLHKLIHHSREDGSAYPVNECPVVFTIREGEGTRREDEVFWRKDGSSFAVEYSSYPVIEKGEIKGAVVAFTDITERKKKQEKISYQAHHDILTGLPNRALLIDHLTTQIAETNRYGEKLALLFMDLDFFKRVNDVLGHEIGDRLLISVAEKLKSILRESETTARVGGDEFLILIPRFKDTGGVRVVAEKTLKFLSEPFFIDENEINISASIGIVIYPEDGSNAKELIANADTAMYLAKELGGNRYQFYKDIELKKKQRLKKGKRRAA